MSISLTENAAQRILTFLHNRGKGEGLRLGVRISGCSGIVYLDGTEFGFCQRRS